jgi:Domain of unknown function (DUF4829)
MKKLVLLSSACVLCLALVGCMKEGNAANQDPQKVVENYFTYKNEKDKDKSLTMTTKAFAESNDDFNIDNINEIKLLDIKEEEILHEEEPAWYKDSRDKEDKQVFKVKYEVKYKDDNITPYPSGVYEWHYHVVREDEGEDWLIGGAGSRALIVYAH